MSGQPIHPAERDLWTSDCGIPGAEVAIDDALCVVLHLGPLDPVHSPTRGTLTVTITDVERLKTALDHAVLFRDRREKDR